MNGSTGRVDDLLRGYAGRFWRWRRTKPRRTTALWSWMNLPTDGGRPLPGPAEPRTRRQRQGVQQHKRIPQGEGAVRQGWPGVAQ
jgi:hypothetical protein